MLAFLPSAVGTLILMPRPVMGAALLFSACFVLISGLQAITSRMLDARRTIVIGLAIASAIAAEIVPDFARDNIPAPLVPVVSSSVVLGTIAALLLNALFRLGQRQRITLTLDPAAADAFAQVDEFFAAAGLKPHGRLVVLNPGAGRPEKRWPAERFAELAVRLVREARARVLVLWGPGEETDAGAIAREAGAVLAPPTDLDELVAVARRAGVMVAGDTGPLHVAAALGTPCVGLYGPTSAVRTFRR